MLEQILKERNVCPLPEITPENWSEVRGKMADILASREYGDPIPAPTSLTFTAGECDDNRFCAGLGITYEVTVAGKLMDRDFSFPIRVCLPKSATPENPVPFFVLCNFHKPIPNMYLPHEEIIDRGFGLISVYYQEVTSDDGDFTNGIASCLYPDGNRTRPTDPGKIRMWAWANMRALDYAQTDGRFDPKNAAVIGHSRLGKTALVTGMQDERFRYVISNDSGCSGAAITAGKQGETIDRITTNFPYWFCPAYRDLAGADVECRMPFDQHFLLASIAPRVLMVGSAAEDLWADPDSEKLACFAAGKAWESLGLDGFLAPNALPEIGEESNTGSVAYHLRPGVHFLSRLDWVSYMDTIDQKKIR